MVSNERQTEIQPSENELISKVNNLLFLFKKYMSKKRLKEIHYKARTQHAKIVSEYDQEKPQSQTADNPVAPRGRAAQPSQDTRKTN